MRTVSEVLALANELNNPEVYKTEYAHGLYVRHTARWTEICNELHKDKIFRCACCDKMVAYADLEDWVCNFEDLDEGLICSNCYERRMGDDL